MKKNTTGAEPVAINIEGPFLNLKKAGAQPSKFVSPVDTGFAKELLAAGKLPVNEIARMSGFASTEFFIRAFRKHTGVTPGSWNHKLQ